MRCEGGSTADLRRLVAAVGRLAPAVDDADRIDRLRHFEELKAAVAAAQAAVAVDFDRSQRAEQAVAGVPAERQGRGVAGQVALARRISPWQAQRWLGWSKILLTELPATYAQLEAGRTTEWRAMLLARETAVLSRENRAAVDTDLTPHLEGWGDRRVESEARRAAYRLDPAAAVARAAAAETDRRVGVRPAPDTMCRLSALLPVTQGVASYAALAGEADRLIAAGDPRSRGQLMADTLTERLTGQAHAADVPVEVTLLMTETSLVDARGPVVHSAAAGSDADDSDAADSGAADSDEPAWLDGYGPVPAGWARELVLGAAHDQAARWLRRPHRPTGHDRLDPP